MNAKQLHEMIQNGGSLVVTFKEAILDQEGYAEPQMRGRIVSSQIKHDDVIEMVVDFTEFDQYNMQFESANHFDKDHNPTLTARQAGFYNMTNEKIFFMVDAFNIDDVLEVERDSRIKLYEKFTRELTTKTYVQWLEDQLA